MKFHWGDCDVDISESLAKIEERFECLEFVDNNLSERISDLRQEREVEYTKKYAELLHIQDDLKKQLEKKDKQICNLELYVNELTAKLLMADEKTKNALHKYGESLFDKPIIEDGEVKWVKESK